MRVYTWNSTNYTTITINETWLKPTFDVNNAITNMFRWNMFPWNMCSLIMFRFECEYNFWHEKCLCLSSSPARNLSTRLRLVNLLIYYMASSASGQDEPNPALWLATRAGKMELSCPLGTTRRVPQETFRRKPYKKSFIDQVWGQDSWILASFSFCVFMDLDYVSVHKNAKKRTWPISSHLDLTLGQ